MNLRSRLVPSFLLTLVCLGAPNAAQAPAQEVTEFERADETGHARVRVKETIIGFEEPGMSEEMFVASPDGRRVAYVVMDSDGLAVVVDGVKGETFEGMAKDSLVFSPDGKHFGYVGTRPPRKQCVVFDGVVHEYRGVSKQGIVFSPEGGRVGWVAEKDGDQVAVIDGQESPPYAGIAKPGIVFSPDGKRYGFTANTGDKHVVVLDGEDGPLFDAVTGLQFSARGQHAVYVGVRDNKEWFAVVDGNPHGPFADLYSESGKGPGGMELSIDAFAFSADGSRVAFAGKRGEEWFVSSGGEELGPYGGIAGLRLSPEGSKTAFMATRGDNWFLTVDGKEEAGRPPESLSFSPDGKRLASVHKRDEKRVAVIDGVEGKEYDRIEQPGIRFSPDNSRTAYAAESAGEKLVVVDGQEGPCFKRWGKTPLSFIPNSARPIYSYKKGERDVVVIDGVESASYASYRSLAFSPDGSRYAYAAEKQKDRWVVVVDGTEYGPGGKLEAGDERAFDLLGKGTPIFSPDGKRTAWIGVVQGNWIAVVDGQESRPYEIVQRSAIGFSPDSAHVVYLAQREGKKMIIVDGFEIDNGWNGFLQRNDVMWSGPRHFSIRGMRRPRLLLIEVEVL